MSLRDFLQMMDRKAEILQVKDEVSPRFEIPYLVKKSDEVGSLLFFDKTTETGTRVVSNVCGTRQRILHALNVHKSDLYRRLLESWRSPQKPRIVDEGPVKEVREKADLKKIPVLTHFEKDPAPYITSAVIHARSLDGRIENVSVHRLQVLDRNHLAIRLVPRHLHRLWSTAKAEGEDLDISISIGVHPAVMLAAASPVPLGVNEFDVANTLMDKKLSLIHCENSGLHAPAEAEMVLEGRISKAEEAVEGPFVDITGTYDIARKQPVVEITSLMHRADYWYQAILPSGSEHRLLMGLPREALIWEAVSQVVPRVNGVNLSIGGSGWLHATISIEKQLDGDSKNALLAAFGAHPSLKHAVVVDSDISPYNISDVEWAIATRFQADKDLVVVENVRGSTLDSSADQETGLTTKMGIDATRPLTKPEVRFVRAAIPATEHVAEIARNLFKV